VTRNSVVVGGVQFVMGTLGTTRTRVRYLSVFVTVTLQLALSIGCAKQQFVLANTLPTESTLTQPITNSTPIEKVLEELRVRFPKDIVIGFEERFDPRPDRELKSISAPGPLPRPSSEPRSGHRSEISHRTFAREAGPRISSKRKCGSHWSA